MRWYNATSFAFFCRLPCPLNPPFLKSGVASFHNSFPEAVKRVSQIALSELPENASEQDKADTTVKVYRGDITVKSDIENIFKDEKIWGVVHIAAHKAVGESGEKPIQYYENNITATINLLDVSSGFSSRQTPSIMLTPITIRSTRWWTDTDATT